ncbi:hypothetical protein EDC01DRAFT_629112 [Geopyxis carbonaria]|nr:hypothetical protein EDC01DRAFT_629112 [Geopyxis carbonaria]
MTSHDDLYNSGSERAGVPSSSNYHQNTNLRFPWTQTEELLREQTFPMPSRIFTPDFYTQSTTAYASNATDIVEGDEEYNYLDADSPNYGHAVASESIPLRPHFPPYSPKISEIPSGPVVSPVVAVNDRVEGATRAQRKSITKQPSSNVLRGLSLSPSDSGDAQPEHWPLKVMYTSRGTAGSNLSTLDPEIDSLYDLRQVIQEASNGEINFHAKEFRNAIIQYRINTWPARESSINLSHDRDLRPMKKMIQSFQKTKRTQGQWNVTIQVVSSKKRDSYDADDSDVVENTRRQRRKTTAPIKQRRTAAATEHAEAEECELDLFAAQIADANACAEHDANKNGCYVKPNGEHVGILPNTLKYWACALKDSHDGVTMRVPPMCHWFGNLPSKQNSIKKTVPEPTIPPTTPPKSLWPSHPIPYGVNPYLQYPHLPPYAGYPPNYGMPSTPTPASMAVSLPTNSPGKSQRRKELLDLPMSAFLAQLENLHPRYAGKLLCLEDLFEDQGITPDLLPCMSDRDLDSILGHNRMGIRLFLRREVGRNDTI